MIYNTYIYYTYTHLQKNIDAKLLQKYHVNFVIGCIMVT